MAVESFYTGFKEKVVSGVQKRGRELAQWDDLLLTSASIYETKAVLEEQEVSPAGLRRDILYSLHYGRPKMLKSVSEAIPFEDVYSRAVTGLRTDIAAFQESQEFLSDPDNREAADMFLGFLDEYLTDKDRMLKDPQGLEVAEIKARILAEVLTGFVEQITPVFEVPSLPTPNVPEDMQMIVAEANQQFTVGVIEKFGTFVQKKDEVIAAQGQPFLALESRDGTEGTYEVDITPYQIVDTACRAADPFLKYVLHRNGLLAPDDYEAICQMPHPLIIEHGLQALKYAESNRERSVMPVHLLPSLLQDPTVLHVILELDEEGKVSSKEDPDPFMRMFGGWARSGRNFIKFYEAIQDAITPQSEGERFRYRVRISDEIKEFLVGLEEVVAQGDKHFVEARMVGALIEKDPKTREVLLSAGLTEEQLQKWPGAVESLIQKWEEARKLRSPDQQEEKKSEKEFKISDMELKDLMDEYTTDLTKLALEGKVDPVIGRNKELYQMMRILLQRGRSNPILLGEPGVGKTALFDGLAQMIASGRAPKALLGSKIYKLDLSAMNSGAMFRGQFEGRLLPIIQGIAERNARGDKPPIILCIDELHTALEAGSAMSTPGAGELLKPYLTRGELSIIGATTQSDYAKYIAIDTALDRRFQPVFVDEPGQEETVEILAGLKDRYETYHQLRIEDSLLDNIVRLSSRYLPNQQQPDKSILVLDAACARARMSEKDGITLEDIVETVAAEANIDPEFLKQGEDEKFLRLKDELPIQVKGQPEATSYIGDALIAAKADLLDPRRPLGVFLLLGPTGVGKTETGRAISRLLHGTEDNMIRIDMSDYEDKHEASRLVGAPPGYVGYGEEGELTGAVRRRPYSVVVLDETEKAHPDVLRRFLPVFEEGELTDGRGRKVSFRNTIILMTSNLGAQTAIGEAESLGLDSDSAPEDWQEATKPIYEMTAKSHFLPEFLNRVDAVIVYNPLSREVIGDLVQTEVDKLSERAQLRYGHTVRVNDEVKEALGHAGYSPEYGARELRRVVRDSLTQPLAGWLLRNKANLVQKSAIEISSLGSEFNAGVVSNQES